MKSLQPILMVLIILGVLIGISTQQAQGSLPSPLPNREATTLSIVNVSAPDINCIFDLDCTIVVTDTSDHFTLSGTTGDAFLQSRTFPPGEPGTVAEGLFGYEYRLDLLNLVGILDIPCITSFNIDFGPVVSLDYDGDGVSDDVYVVTAGGLGTVAPTTVSKEDNTITFDFAPPVCAGGAPGNGESTFFFGLTSRFPARNVVAQIRDNTGVDYTLDARAPTAAQCPDGNTTDSDGDALLDCWEMDGLDFDGDGVIDLELYDVNQDGIIQPDERADPNHKDIYVEIDWMAQHQPNALALNNVINSFASAPVSNPDGTSGIRLHIQTDEQAMAHNNDFAFVPCTASAGAGIPDFDNVKSTRFGTTAERAAANSANILNAKRFAFHYVFFVHNLLGLGGTSGCAEVFGNDFVVSLGSWAVVGGHDVGNTDQQAGTFMHEFGHNLDLRHGGSDNVNCKPNYLSVMSYARQIDNIFVFNRPLDYSSGALLTLNETNLSEPAGISGSFGDRTAFGPPPIQTNVDASSVIDWNTNGLSTDIGVNRDINNFGFIGCGGFGANLQGYDDWINLQYNFRDSTDFADGVHLTVSEVDEMNIEEVELVSPDTDDDNVVNIRDNCPFAANPNQEDADGDGIGDACEDFTAVELSSFTAQAITNHIILTWQTAGEINNEGFNIWRSETKDGEYTQINPTLIPAQGDTNTGASYEYVDTDVVKGKTYWYKLEDIDATASSTFHGPISTTASDIQRTYLPMIMK